MSQITKEKGEMIRKQKKMREHIFQMLFIMDFRDQEEMEEQLKLYLEDECAAENPVLYDETYIEEIKEKFRQVCAHKNEIDEILNRFSKGWKVERMGKADLNIMRLAVYELEFDPVKTAVPIIINDAVELAKNYGQDNSYSFVNGILGKVARQKAIDRAMAEKNAVPEDDAKEEES